MFEEGPRKEASAKNFREEKGDMRIPPRGTAR